MLAFCYSLNSDVSMLLRRCGLFSIMVLSHDIKMLTKNPKAKLNENQRKLVEKIGIIVEIFYGEIPFKRGNTLKFI